jgi:hypothetical protein
LKGDGLALARQVQSDALPRRPKQPGPPEVDPLASWAQRLEARRRHLRDRAARPARRSSIRPGAGIAGRLDALDAKRERAAAER